MSMGKTLSISSMQFIIQINFELNGIIKISIFDLILFIYDCDRQLRAVNKFNRQNVVNVGRKMNP